MAMNISNILSTYGSNNLTTAAATQQNVSNTNFSNFLSTALSGTGSSMQSNEDFLLSALSSSSNANLEKSLLSGNSSMNLFTESLTNTADNAGTGFSPPIDSGNSTTIDQQIPGTSYFSDMLTNSLQSQVTSMMTNAKMQLENNLNMYIEKTQGSSSFGVQETISRMQNNISTFDSFIAERKTANSLLDALNANSSLTQYFVNKNRTSAF